MEKKIVLDYYKGEDLYSDGEVEDEILSIVKKDNYTLPNDQVTWPIFYHLSPFRRNILEWFNFKKNATLLEVGAGCGALTGLFSEKVSQVCAVDLSKKRTEINLARNDNKKNVSFVVGNIEDIKFDISFDYVTLIGVLEYAGKFTKTLDPFSDFLKKIKSFLNNDGKLILAIENKYGIKYWAGAKEDHTGVVFNSIEDYPNSNEIKTFGKKELINLLRRSGFDSFDFYYPYPDYKFADKIYSDDFLPSESEIFQSYTPNFDQKRYILFDESLVLKGIIKNGQYPFFSNSFLVVASL